MDSFKFPMTAAALAGALCFASAAFAQATAPEPKGESMMASADVTATVTSIDQATRKVTLQTDAGEVFTFVADDAVKNLPQVKVGDKVTATYAEALAYEVKKGGKVADVATAVAGGSAEPGQKPKGAIARQTTATVLITAIDPGVPSVTFQGPAGNKRTIKVMHPEKLAGVSVGDTVEITYTEALAIKVEDAPKQ